MQLSFLFTFATVSLRYRAIRANENSPGFYRQFRDGNILIGGALEIHRHAGNGNCGVLRAKGVQDVELINMLIDKTNANQEILRGIKLGSVIVDTCAWPSHALKMVFNEIIPFVHEYKNNDNCLCNSTTDNNKRSMLAGVLGPGTSKVAIQLASQLEVFSIPQVSKKESKRIHIENMAKTRFCFRISSHVSHSATLQELGDKSLYSYFFRTVPPDHFMMRAMIEFASEMNWNYVSIVFENDCLGRNAYLALERSLREKGLCLAGYATIPEDATDADYEKIARQLLENEQAKAVILYSKSIPTEKVISTTRRISNNSNQIVWIGSDGWANYLPLKDGDNSYVDGLDGAIAYTPYGKHIDAVDLHMSKLKLADRYGPNFQMNPWFSELLALQNECSLINGTNTRNCEGQEMLKGTVTTYDGLFNLENAFEAFVNALDAFHRDICQNKSGMCPAMSSLYGTNSLAEQLRMYLRNVSFVDARGRNFTFDKNQNGPPSYFINTFDKRNIVDPAHQRQGWKHIGFYTKNENFWFGQPMKANMTDSVCSQPCDIGEEMIIDTQQACCWTCRTCSKSQFVSPNTSLCEQCPPTRISNKGRNGCDDLPIRSMGFHSIYSVVCIVIGCFGIILTFVVTAIYIVNRESAIVKASGGELCFIVLFGNLLTFCNCFAFGAPATFASCFAARFILSIGPTTMYAALLVKSLPVVLIFKYKANLSPKIKSMLQPIPLSFIILFIVIIEGVLFMVWSILNTFTPISYVSEEDYVFLTCPGVSTLEIFYGLILPFVMIIICTVFATINWKVPAGFNESLYIGLTMYATCVIWIAFIPLFVVNSNNIPIKMTTTSVCLSASALAVLLCVFVPRCYMILVHPEENTRNAVMTPTRSQGLNIRTSTISDDPQRKKFCDIQNITN